MSNPADVERLVAAFHRQSSVDGDAEPDLDEPAPAPTAPAPRGAGAVLGSRGASSAMPRPPSMEPSDASWLHHRSVSAHKEPAPQRPPSARRPGSMRRSHGREAGHADALSESSGYSSDDDDEADEVGHRASAPRPAWFRAAPQRPLLDRVVAAAELWGRRLLGAAGDVRGPSAGPALLGVQLLLATMAAGFGWTFGRIAAERTWVWMLRPLRPPRR